MSHRIDFYALDQAATRSTRKRLGELTTADLDRPTATTGWDIRGLLAHLVGGNLRFAHALRGELPEWRTRDDELVTSPLGEFDASAAAMAASIADIADPKQAVHLPAGEPSAYFAVGVHGADMLIHGWDLAVTMGQDPALDPDLCLAATAVIDKYPPTFWGAGRFFADQIETSSTDPMQRLLALTGRDSTLHNGPSTGGQQL